MNLSVSTSLIRSLRSAFDWLSVPIDERHDLNPMIGTSSVGTRRTNGQDFPRRLIYFVRFTVSHLLSVGFQKAIDKQ
jgi:hypothetical protein